MVTPMDSSSNPLTTSLDSTSPFGSLGNSLSTDSNVFPSNTSFGSSSSSIPTSDSILSEISNRFDTEGNNLPLTSTTSAENPFTSQGNGAQNFGLRIRTAIDSMVGGVGGSGAGIPVGGTGSESSGNGTPTTGNNGSGSDRPNLGPFDRLLDIPGVNGVEDIFGGLGGGDGSGGNGGSFGGGASGGSPFTGFGDPNAPGSALFGGQNPWSAINTAQAGADNGSGGSPVAGGNSFGSGSGSGNPFTSGVSTPVAADAGTTAPNIGGDSFSGQWTWDFAELENGGGIPSFGGGSGGEIPSFGGRCV